MCIDKTTYRAKTPTSTLRTKTTLLLVFIFSLSCVNAQEYSQDQIVSSYLYNFAKNIEWPHEQDLSTFNIAIYRPQNLGLYNEIKKLASQSSIKGIPINVQKVNSFEDIAKHQVLFLESINNQNVEALYNQLNGNPVLIVTHGFEVKQYVMINLETNSTNQLYFEVNNANLLNHGLKPLPELILNGGSEIDVAKLFREGQASLITLQKQLILREKKLTKLSAQIDKQIKSNKELEASLSKLSQEIEESESLINSQKQNLKQQEFEISRGEKEREKLFTEMEVRTKSLLDTQRKLNNRQIKLEGIQQDIELKEKQLSQLNSTINQQSSTISELDQLVVAQKRSLTYLWALFTLGILFAGSLLFGYLMKRRHNLKLRARTEELQIARDRLAIAKSIAEEANQAKGRFLSLMSHELRTPLQAIIGYSEVVLDELTVAGEAKHVNDITRVLNNSERLLKLINSVLDLAKIESGKMELSLTQVNIDTLMAEVLDNIQPQFDKAGNRLYVDIKSIEKEPEADYDKLLQIIINLLSNSCKFTDKGDVTVSVCHKASCLRISVKDTGIGLTKEQQKHIFDQFKQADTSTTRRFGGTGLGLTITKQFTEMMGGTISVKSDYRQGSTFAVEIPLPINPIPQQVLTDEVEVTSGVSSPTTLEAAPDTPCILIVDNDPVYTDIISRTLRLEGHTVYTANTAESGYELALKIMPDIITLDILLPDKHGSELYRKIKSHPTLSNVPIVVASVHDQASQSADFKVDAYFTKPVSRFELKSAIKRLSSLN